MEPLKDMFSKKFYQQLAGEFNKADKNFNADKFVKEMMDGLESLSLNERMRKTSVVLKNHLPGDLKKSLSVMFRVIPNINRGYTSLVFPDYVGLYGHEHFEASMEALKFFTGFGSSEFAIREFLKRDFKKTVSVMYQWAESPDAHTRRLSSEGSRPRLPWSFKLDAVIADPKLTAPILERLKNDEELYVRKSVANHLNDISKDNADYMLKLVGSWDKAQPNTSWIIKHASRSLIKKGHADSLAIFDFEKNAKVQVENFKIKALKLKLGESLEFSFDLLSLKSTAQKLVIDYVIHYQKKSGELSPKVFKLTEMTLQPRQTVHVGKKQMFKDFTTRKHFGGRHLLAIQVNGKIVHEQEFHLSV